MNHIKKEKSDQQYSEWLGGQKIAPLKFIHNSVVEAALPDGTVKIGWVVSANVNSPEPIYTIELTDGSGDILCDLRD